MLGWRWRIIESQPVHFVVSTSQQIRQALQHSTPKPMQWLDNLSKVWYQMYQQENRSLADKFINCLACLASMCSGQNLEVRMSNPLSGGTTDVKCLQQFHCHLPCQACHCLQYTAANATLLQVCPMASWPITILLEANIWYSVCVCACLHLHVRLSLMYSYMVYIYFHLFVTLNYIMTSNDQYCTKT